MLYTSTRNKNIHVTSSEAIAHGISAEGGLFVPESIPEIGEDFLAELSSLGYADRAKKILSLYLTDFTAEEISACVEGAYREGKFSSPAVAPCVWLSEGVYVLELWRGPTCAFKDMALQLLPHLLTVAAGKTAKDKTIVILVATSGDTGKAALEGFRDVKGTKIMVFYPNDGVSPMQKLQMTTQEGENVSVCAINGNFDDAQNGVKAIFTDKTVAERLAEHGMMFSSANSINWGRLVPQIVYYISAYCDLISSGNIKNGDKVNIVVPTGNFGNILAAYYAMRMGLPVNKLICASNANNVLTDFINSGVYDRNRRFFTTTSPSMDILISSNLERLLFELCGKDDEKVRMWMDELKENGRYEVTDDVKTTLSDLFVGGFCDDKATADTIGGVFRENSYLCDTHTAVGLKVYTTYRAATDDSTATVIASTANPFKFSAAVLGAVGGEKCEDEFKMLEQLEKKTGEACPTQLAGLSQKPVRFTSCCNRENMPETVFGMLGI